MSRADMAVPNEETDSLVESSGALLENLLLNAVDGVIAADLKGRILLFNDAASEILGYSRHEALEKLNIRDIYPPGGAMETMRMLRSLEHGGKGKLRSATVQILRKDGLAIPVRLNASLIYERGREIASVGFFRDLREEQRMKEELSHTQMQLLQAEKMASLGKLAAGVAHQLNNPLNGITLFTVMTMEDYSLPTEVKKNLFRIRKDAERCREIVKELLGFARQSDQNTRLHNINHSLERTLFLLENQALFQNIQIEKQLDPSLPLIPVDVQQMNHVFMNIILNAADAMQGRGKLAVRSSLQAEGQRIRIEIQDTGCGIAPEVLPHIFEPFYTTKEAGKGTGLGLSVAYGIIHDHQGTIRVASSPGQGSTFFVELPVCPQASLKEADRSHGLS
jgi:PAS domain S-box-containing protein